MWFTQNIQNTQTSEVLKALEHCEKANKILNVFHKKKMEWKIRQG